MRSLDDIALEIWREQTKTQQFLNVDILEFAHRLVEKLAKQEPVAWMCPNDPDANSAFIWASKGIDYSGLSCQFCGNAERIPLYAAPIVKGSVAEQDKFCDNNCTWLDHHSDCVRAEPTMSQYANKLDYLRAAAEKLGYVVVPREPTEKMMDAYRCAFISQDRFDGVLVYKAMLEAAREE